MKKILGVFLLVFISLFVITGCDIPFLNTNGGKQSIVGKYEIKEYWVGDTMYTKEQLKDLGSEVTFEFKADGTVVRVLNGKEKTFTYDEKNIYDGTDYTNPYTISENGEVTVTQENDRAVLVKTK